MEGVRRAGADVTAAVLTHERGALLAGLGGLLLLGRGAGEGRGLGLGGEALLVAAVATTEEGEGGDAQDDGDAKDDGDDDAGNVERVLQVHADVITIVVHGAGFARGAVRGGDLGGEARHGVGLAVDGLERAGLCLGVRGGEAVVASLLVTSEETTTLVKNVGRGQSWSGSDRRDGLLEDLAAAATKLGIAGEELRAAVLGGGGLGTGDAGAAASLAVAVGDGGGVGVSELGETQGESHVVAAAGVGGHLAAVGEEAVVVGGLGIVVAGDGGGQGARGEEEGGEDAHGDGWMSVRIRGMRGRWDGTTVGKFVRW